MLIETGLYLAHRLGDAVIQASKTVQFNWEHVFSPWARCAQGLEESLGVVGQSVKWLLVTDSVQLKTWAEEKFPGKILPGSKGRVAHYKEGVLTSAAVDNWLLGLTHLKVISELSHFGRSAAMRTNGGASVYTIRQNWTQWARVGQGQYLEPIEGFARKCDVRQPDQALALLSAWYEM